MEMKKLTPTRAKLPANEMIIGGDASPRMFSKRDVEKTDVEYQEYRRKNGKK